eukprot:CAMPEP_0170340492 /NCGR_PEP_ID=MMETSP0116_2-20130129/71353_1 /TAXON_ID=400756 /ORGANISM="Durinskia baltica, Strain CSIRO CS-38" /LENGTH=63 /DNA_ID=CAMNT_0010594009 /DNA_START=51 /DNA_END=239 /DNA_ORIENTATION=+
MNVSVAGLSVSVAARDGPARRLLSDISCKIDFGDSVALMGPSGAGKTTLLNRLAGRGIVGEVA